MITGRHFFQSHQWAEFQEALGSKFIERKGNGWQYMAVIEHGYGFVGSRFKRLYCPYGPYYESEKALSDSLKDLNEQGIKYNVDYIRIEPTCPEVNVFDGFKYGYKRQSRDFQPSLTSKLDIGRPFEEIEAGMSKTNRYLWKHANRDGITFKTSYSVHDLEVFVLMMRETAERTQKIFKRTEYYELLLKILGPNRHAGVAYALHNNEVISGSLFVDDNLTKTRYYMYAGSLPPARKLSVNARLVCYLLYDAHKKGLETFDFFGVSPPNEPNHDWVGFSNFKRSFGGNDHAYSGTWEKPINKTKYKLMHLTRKLTSR